MQEGRQSAMMPGLDHGDVLSNIRRPRQNSRDTAYPYRFPQRDYREPESPDQIVESEEREGIYRFDELERIAESRRIQLRPVGRGTPGNGLRSQGRRSDYSAREIGKIVAVDLAPCVFWGGVATIIAFTVFNRLIFPLI